MLGLAACIAATNAISLKTDQRGNVILDDAEADNRDAANSDCTPAELDFVDNAIAAALPAIEHSLENENPELFNKWFGVGSAASDADVRSRLADATWMMTQRGRNWTPMCCKSGGGACGPSCQYTGV